MPRREREHRSHHRRSRRDHHDHHRQQAPMTVNVKMDITTYGPHNGVIVQSGFFSGRPSTSYNNLSSLPAESMQDLYGIQYPETPQLHGKYGSTPLLKSRPHTPMEDFDEPPDEFIQPEKVQLNIFGENESRQPSPYPTRSQSRLSNQPYVQQPTDNVLQDTTTTTTTVEVFRTKYDPNNPHEYIHLPPAPESNDHGQLLRAIGPPYEQWQQQKLETQIDDPGYISYRTPTPTPKAVQWARSASVSPNRAGQQIYENLLSPYRNGYGSQLSLNVSEAPILDAHDQNILRTTKVVNQQQQLRPARAVHRTRGYRNPRSRSESRQDHLGHYNHPLMLRSAFSSPRSPAPTSDVNLYKTRDAWGNIIREVPLTAIDDDVVIDESNMRISPVSESETSIFSDLSLKRERKPPPVPPHRSLSAAPARRSFTERNFVDSYGKDQKRWFEEQRLPEIDHRTSGIYENLPRRESRPSRRDVRAPIVSRSSSRQSRSFQNQTEMCRMSPQLARNREETMMARNRPQSQERDLYNAPMTSEDQAHTARQPSRLQNVESGQRRSFEGFHNQPDVSRQRGMTRTFPRTSPQQPRQADRSTMLRNQPQMHDRAAFGSAHVSRQEISSQDMSRQQAASGNDPRSLSTQSQAYQSQTDLSRQPITSPRLETIARDRSESRDRYTVAKIEESYPSRMNPEPETTKNITRTPQRSSSIQSRPSPSQGRMSRQSSMVVNATRTAPRLIEHAEQSTVVKMRSESQDRAIIRSSARRESSRQDEVELQKAEMQRVEQTRQQTSHPDTETKTPIPSRQNAIAPKSTEMSNQPADAMASHLAERVDHSARKTSASAAELQSRSSSNVGVSKSSQASPTPAYTRPKTLQYENLSAALSRQLPRQFNYAEMSESWSERPSEPRPFHRTVSEPINELSIQMFPLEPAAHYGMRLLREEPNLPSEVDDAKYFPQSIMSSKLIRSKYPPVGSDSPSSSRRIRFSEELTSVSIISSSEGGSSSSGSLSDDEEDDNVEPDAPQLSPPPLEIVSLAAEPRAKPKSAPEFVEFKEEPKIRKTATPDVPKLDLNYATPTVTLDEHRLRITNFEFER